MHKSRPHLFYALLLKCPYCRKTPLLRAGSWFDFGKGCDTCNYRYEREEGYFAGSTWMINYTIISLFGIAVAAFLALGTQLNGLMIASLTSVSIIAFGFLFFPFGSALWMYFDHVVHPLQDKDRLHP